MSANTPAQAPPAAPQVAQPRIAFQGDGQARVANSMDRAHSGDGQARRTSTKPPGATRADTWKLVMLVILFLVWISTASALLFLYMDRYLFPG